jgi:SAM-dependent methyltransferase
VCPACRGRIAPEEPAAFACRSCGAVYPERSGALCLLSPPPAAHDLADLPETFVEAVADKLGLPRSPEVLSAVRAAVRDTRMSVAEHHLSAEIAELADRLGIEPATAPEETLGPERASRPNLVHVTNYIEPRLPAGASVLRSVRVRNEGQEDLQQASFACAWSHPDGRAADAAPAAPSPLLCRLRPGQETTVLIRLHTPPRQGAYRLEIRVAGAATPLHAVAVSIVPEAPVALPLPRSDRVLAYDEDHIEAGKLLSRVLAAQLGDRRGRILEIGGGIHPQVATLAADGHDAVSADVSFPMSQLGALYFQYPGAAWIQRGRLAFLACDGNRLPFADGTFDAVVLFATLHHIAQPDRFLAGLRRLLAPAGFVGIFCEPCEPNPDDALYLRDLRKGVNEQQFTLSEWATIFERAGARVFEGRIDGGSLKVLLRFG